MSSWITLPKHFQTGMVLQQQVKTELTGVAEPNLSFSVEWTRLPLDPQAVSPLDPRYGTIHSDTLSCDGKGKFKFELPACEASFDTYQLLIRDGDRHLQFNDILVGDVFLFIGGLVLPDPGQNGQSRKPTSGTVPATLPYLRQYDCLATDSEMAWTSHTHFEPDNAGLGGLMLTALGQHFGRELLPEIHTPIGLMVADSSDRRIRDWLPDNKKGMFRAISALGGMGTRAVIWSGNPSDLLEADRLQTGLMKLATAMRTQLKSPKNLPPAFILFHLPTSQAGQATFYQQTLGNEALTYVRHRLTAPTALVPVTGLVSRQPLPVLADRLRAICLGLIYQRKAPQSAPECESIEVVGGKMMLTFSNIGEGLRLTDDNTRVRGFTICGSDRVFREAQAKVLYGVRVMVWHDEISTPTAVTYGFYDLNERANLISKDHLPIVPFRSDQEPSVYALPREWMHCDDPAEWQTFAGSIKIQRETANKSEGESSLSLVYQTDPNQQVIIGPWIDRAVDFPPLDLQHAANLAVNVFNPDRHEKTLCLKILTIVAPGAKEFSTPPQRILPALRWQTLTFDLSQVDPEIDLTQVIRLQFVFQDKKGGGQVYLDHIRQVCR